MGNTQFAGRARLGLLVLVALLLVPSVSGSPSLAQVVREDDSELSRNLKLPLRVWYQSAEDPIAVVIAVHGLVMHAGVFDGLARYLAERGFLVVAPDVRGYGRWYHDNDHGQPVVSYDKSVGDIIALAERLQDDHPGLPMFLVGESMGASLSLRVAARRPELVDGLILSSPALKRRLMFSSHVFTDAAALMANPRRQLDLRPYIRANASDDPRIVKEIIDDPLTRLRLSVKELLHSLRTMRATLGCVKAIPPTMPVLVIQGSADRTLKANAVVLLLAKLRSMDQTVKWLPQKGHILLETAYLNPSTLETLGVWLKDHARRPPPLHAASQNVPDAPATR